jgi:hypothetical protein
MATKGSHSTSAKNSEAQSKKGTPCELQVLSTISEVKEDQSLNSTKMIDKEAT